MSAAALHPPLQKIWKVPPEVLKVLVCPVHDQSLLKGGEDVFVDVR